MSDTKRGTEDQQHPSNAPRNPTNSDTQGQEPSQSQPSQSQPSSSSSAPSLTSRIQSSAAGLARNAFTSGPTTDAQLLASGTNAKAGGASSSSSGLSAAQQYRQETSLPSSSSTSHNPSSISTGATFRSSSAEHPQLSERGGFKLPPLSADEFQRAPIDDPFAQTTTGKGKSPATATASHTPQWTQHQEPSEPDGAAVLSLLNSPSFDPEFPETANEPFEPVETELAPPTQLTPAEIEMLDSFRRQLNIPVEPSQQQQQPHRLTSFSLVPDIASVLDSAPSSTATDATALRDDVLARLPGAADWIPVEERYHDEVWGYLRPALEAAAKEMEEKRDNGSGSESEGPAVRRLKMILKHMQA